MRIAFLTNKTAKVSLPIFQALANSQEVELVHTFIYDNVSQKRKESIIKVVAQLGVQRVVTKVLATAFSVLRRKLGKWLPGQVQAQSPFEMAVTQRMPHSIIANINQVETIELIRELKLDALVVCVCTNILRKNVLSLPNMRFINIHPSLLPKYRGPSPAFWALYHNENETGITFHLMTPRIDRGNILKQLAMPLDQSKSETEIEHDAFKLGATVAVNVLLNIAANDNQDHIPQDESQASYFTFPTPAQRRDLDKRLRDARSSQ